MLTLSNATIYADGQALLRFDSTPQAGVYMLRLGFRSFERGGVFYFFKPSHL